MMNNIYLMIIPPVTHFSLLKLFSTKTNYTTQKGQFQ